MNEFELIRRYFADGGSARDDVVLGDSADRRFTHPAGVVVEADSLAPAFGGDGRDVVVGMLIVGLVIVALAQFIVHFVLGKVSQA